MSATKAGQHHCPARPSLGMPEEKLLSDRLRSAMQSKGWSENELSRRSGVPQPTIHRIITGESKSPRTGNLEKLAASLEVSVAYLSYGNGAAGGPHETPGASQIPGHASAERRAQELSPLASPRSQEALDHIAQAAQEGWLTEGDLLLLEQIAERIAAKPDAESNRHNKRHQRLKETLGNHDPPADT